MRGKMTLDAYYRRLRENGWGHNEAVEACEEHGYELNEVDRLVLGNIACSIGRVQTKKEQ